MKKLNLTRWLLTALAAMTVFSAPAAKKTFTAVTANVDGLPPNVHLDFTVYKTDVSMNSDGSQDTGATRMGQLIAENLWDIVALSEDFNYHNYIMNGVNTYYNAATWRGLIDQNNLACSNRHVVTNYLLTTDTDNKGIYMLTDGLGFLTRKKYEVNPGTDAEGEGNNWIPWNDHFGFTNNEADGLIRKGFRFYQVKLGEGLIVDVYITHMEAGSESGDNDARAKQLIQFAEYIKAHKGANPIIILGDTNCRYTRDPLKAGFIDLIEQDTDLKVQDPWVQHMRDGEYPAPNSPSLMVSTLGEQKGEVVDKIWYINNKKSPCTLTCTGYLHDDTFTYADGSQIADHYPVVGTFVIENPDAPEPTTGEVTIPEAPAKGAIVSGQTYFIRNLGSGKFLRAGGAYTTQAVMGDYPSKVTPTKSGSGYTMNTTHENDTKKKTKHFINCTGTEYYVDQGSNVWTLTQVKDNVYRMKDASGNAVGFNGDILAPVSYSETDINQQWEFLTEADLRHELYSTTSDNPKDVTFLMKAPDFGYCDQESWTTSFPKNNWSDISSSGKTIIREEGQNNISMLKMYNTSQGTGASNTWTLSQTISNLPAGSYIVKYQLCTYNLAEGGNHHFTINGAPAKWTNEDSDPGSLTVAQRMAVGQYKHELTVKVDNTGTYANKIEIAVNKEHNGSATGAYYDNFNIKCISIDGILDQTVYDRVNVAIQDAKAKAQKAGLTDYRNGQVETLWAEKEITGDGWAEIKRTYKNLGEAVLTQSDIPCDYTYAIVNPSFELYPDYKDGVHTIDGGYPFGWSYPAQYAKDSGVWPKTSEYKKIEKGADGDYIFNTWDNNVGGNAVYQEVTLTPGIYKLTAKVTSDKGNKVYLFAGDKNVAKTIEGDQGESEAKLAFEDVELYFPVPDGKPFNLGVAGADGNGNFTMTGGQWYKADDFRLTRMGGAETIKGMEMLQLAINEVTSRLEAKKWNDDYCKGELAKYQAMIDNYTLVGDGTKEFEEVYKLIRDKVFAQTGTGEIDYTYALANPSFEWGNTYGWDLTNEVGDTGAKNKSEGTYNFSACDQTYVFNTWSENGNYGTPISQTISNLPPGHYKLQATFASDAGTIAYLEAIGLDPDHTQRESYTCTDGLGTGKKCVLEFDVADTSTPITLRAGTYRDGSWNQTGGTWYKVDDFKLYRSGDAKICFFYKRLLNAINEANSVAGELPAYYANQWDASDYQDLIDKHLADGHNPEEGETSEKYDPLNGSSGIQEINDLFDRMRTLIFSQQESGADMSGAITNNSFELGDLTGWTTYIEVGEDAQVVAADENTPVYGTKDVDGTYLYNAWKGGIAHPIYQVIPNMPSGKYTLTVKVASDLGAKFFLGANDKHSKIFYITKDGNRHNILGEDGSVIAENQPGEFCEFSFTFEVPVDAVSKDVKIGVYPTVASSYEEINETHFADDAVGPWYKVDHFRLTLDSRYLEVNWKMETPTHGTIMLPFDVSAEELAAQNLEAYSIKFSEESKTPSDWDVNNYRILNWVGPHDGKEHEDGLHQDGIKAYNPYVLKNIAPVDETESVSAMNAKVSVKAAEGETANDPQANYTGNYKFSGYTQYRQTDPDDETSGTVNAANNTSGTLTGTLVDVSVSDEQHHLTQLDDESSVGFMSHKEHGSDQHDEVVPAYHAYMLNPKEELRKYDGFYFYEPLQKIELVMEAGKYGTLVLPFEAELSEDLKAYKLTGVSEVRNYSVVDASKGSYQVLEKVEVSANAEGKVILEENTPYLIEDLMDNRTGKITFIGQANNVNMYENSPEGNLLTGLFVSRNKDNAGYMDAGHWVLCYDNENDRAIFTKLSGTTNQLNAYNAYIAKPATTETPVTPPAAVKAVSLLADGAEPIQLQADELLIDEPEVSENWTMDNQYVGTLVLPFDVDAQVLIDNDLKAYKITGVETEQTKNGVTYHILKRDESIEGLTANEAYMITSSGETQTVNFKGTAGASQTPVETGLMLGTYSPITAPENSYVANAEKGLDFKKVGADGAPVAKLHAYIPAASDLTGTYLVVNDDTVDVTEIMEGEVNVDIYTLDGVMVRRDVKAAEALQELDHGIYILRSAKGTVKVIK